MAEQQVPMEPAAFDTAGVTLAERLERSEIAYFPVCPFPLPQGDDLRFLLVQKLARGGHKNISYDPHKDKVSGFQNRSRAESERLLQIFGAFARNATGWLARVLPQYASAWRLDKASLRPEEEATRHLRLKARNDLLHVDAFPTRPTNGYRILRCFANINPTEPRIWVTSEPFARLLERYGREVGLPTHAGLNWTAQLHDHVARLFNPKRPRRSVYDAFMLRFHDFLKMNDVFQEHCPKRYWTFPPGSAWVVFTDTVSHAALRGRSALEHTYLIPPETLLIPTASPAACLQRACGKPVLNAA
jgi:hypothetical protein